MKYRILSCASSELTQAIEFYESKENGLGKEFLNEFEFSMDLICSFPMAWSKINNEFRRCILRRFPYGIIYTAHSDEILVVAFMNLYKKPDYWKNRI